MIVEQHRERGKVWFRVDWQTGATREHTYRRRVRSYAEHAELEALEQRLRQLHGHVKMDHEIAAALNAEGFRTTRGGDFSGQVVWLLRQRWKFPP